MDEGGMMAETYNPSTDYVREAYGFSGEGLDFKRVAYARMEEFDRWLNLVKAEAWSEGYAGGQDSVYTGHNEFVNESIKNPYRQDYI